MYIIYYIKKKILMRGKCPRQNYIGGKLSGYRFNLCYGDLWVILNAQLRSPMPVQIYRYIVCVHSCIEIINIMKAKRLTRTSYVYVY